MNVIGCSQEIDAITTQPGQADETAPEGGATASASTPPLPEAKADPVAHEQNGQAQAFQYDTQCSLAGGQSLLYAGDCFRVGPDAVFFTWS